MTKIDIATIRQLATPETIEITVHALKRLEQRGILFSEVLTCLELGEIVEEYPSDFPNPSCLLFTMISVARPLHVVVGVTTTRLWIITAYIPSQDIFETDFKTRRRH